MKHTIPNSPISEFLHHPDWETIHSIEKNQKKLEMLIRERPFLMAHYRVQIAYIIQLSEQTHKYDPKLAQEIEKALQTITLLKKIYLRLDEPDDVTRADLDITTLVRILYQISNVNKKIDMPFPPCTTGLSHRLRGLHLSTNLSRLTAIRIRRLILACIALPFFSSWRPHVTQIEAFTGPFFLYLGWLFFLPRFSLNFLTILRKLCLPQKENGLPWSLRIEAFLNLHRRLYELWTDTAWLSSGILLCFVLFGTSAIWRPLTILAVQISDTIMMTTRSFFELRRLFFLKKEYEENIQKNGTQPNPGYLKALEERIAYEKKVSYLVITNNILMTIALLTILPSVALCSPWIPVLGALLGVLTTLRFYVYNAKNDSQQPKMNLNLILKNYETSDTTPPTNAPATLLINKIIIPATLVLTPLILMMHSFNPILGICFCVSLAIGGIYKAQQSDEMQTSKKNFESIMRHQFFKPQSMVTSIPASSSTPPTVKG